MRLTIKSNYIIYTHTHINTLYNRPNRGVVLTTHPKVSAEVMKGLGYTSTHPLGLRGLLQGELFFYYNPNPLQR